MRSLIEMIKKYWDILGGTILGIVTAFVAKWEMEKIQLVYSIIILILLYIGFLKVMIPRKRKKNVVDKLVNKQKPIEAIMLSQNPTQNGEELGVLVKQTLKGSINFMEKVKRALTWLKYNFLELSDILFTILIMIAINFALFYDKIYTKIDFLNQQSWVKWVGLGLTIIYTIIDIWVSIAGKVNSLKEIDQLIEEKNIQKLKALPNETKKLIKNRLKEKKALLKSKENQLIEITNSITSLTQLGEVGIATQKDINDLQQNLNLKQQIEIAIADINREIGEYEKVLA